MDSQNISLTGRPGETADYWKQPASPLLQAIAILVIVAVVGYIAFMLLLSIAFQNAHFGW